MVFYWEKNEQRQDEQAFDSIVTLVAKNHFKIIP